MTETVHVITDLGPTDGPGLVVPAEMLGWDPVAARRRRAQAAWSEQVDERARRTIADAVSPEFGYRDPSYRSPFLRHTNEPCNPKPHP